jgi:hypothetical protein
VAGQAEVVTRTPDPAAALADAVAAASGVAQVIRWTTPRDTSRHLARLRDLLRAPRAQNYGELFEFPAPDEAEVRARTEDALRLADRLDDDRLVDLVRDHLHGLREHVAAIASRDPGRLSAWARTHTGLPTPATLARATAMLAGPVTADENAPTATTHDLVQALQSALDAYELDSWAVEVEPDMGARAAIAGTRRLVRVRSGLALTTGQVRRLVVHEVGGHVLRWENAWRQPEPLLAVPLGDATSTEEGLAVLLEEECGVIDDQQLRLYAARVMAVQLAQEHGIVDVGRGLAEYVDVGAAAEIALRVKRGLPDPNVPGGPTKDHGYLTGYLAARQLEPESVRLLRGAKWPLALMPELRRLADLGTMTPARVLADPELLGVSSPG